MTSKKAKKEAENQAAVLAKIASWRDPYNAIGERLHQIITETVPELKPRLWYGMPGYAKAGPVLVFFRVDDYMTFGLTEKANFSREPDATDQLMPNAWFFTALDKATEARIAEIVRQATS